MNEGKRLLKIILILTLVMGGLTVGLLYAAGQREKNNIYIVIDPNTMELIQLEKPKNGDPIAVIDTTEGEIRMVLYPEQSPEAVKNFTELASSGYYDNTYIFESRDGKYCGGGTPAKNGSVGKSTNEHIKRELSQDLWPFRGAVCMAQTDYIRTFKQKVFGGGTYYNGSRFYILNSIDFTDDVINELNENSANQALADAFVEKGGIPNFSQQMTIIGQTYKGFDVIEKLSSLEGKNTGNYITPNEDVMIRSIKISTYNDADEADENISGQDKSGDQ